MTLTQNGFTADSPLVNYCYPAPGPGSATQCWDYTSATKCLVVVHCVVAPFNEGIAASLMGPAYFGHGGDAGNPVSVQYMTDDKTTAQGVHEADRAWGAGPYANDIAIHIEQAGYAYFTRAQWTTPYGLAMIARTAALIADICTRHPNIQPRQLTGAELQTLRTNANSNPSGAHTGGYVPHAQVTSTLGGTTHTDTGDNYPFDLLQAGIDQILTPQGSDMPLSDDDINKIATRLQQADVGAAISLQWFATPLAGTSGTAGAVLANVWNNASSAVTYAAEADSAVAALSAKVDALAAAVAKIPTTVEPLEPITGTPGTVDPSAVLDAIKAQWAK